MSNELSRRFDQQDIKIVTKMEKKMLLSATSNRDTQVPMVVQDTYKNDLKMELLQTQLKLMPQLISRHREITRITIKKVTNIRTLCDIMNANSAAKSMRSEIHSLLKLYMTVPVTIATAERTFSTMRRIKTYLHSTMIQERLNHALMLNAHKSRVDDLDLTYIAKLFISVNERWCLYFGKM